MSSVVVLGIPWDENSSHLRGPADAPSRIRQELHSGACNLCAEDGSDLGAEPRYQELGDVDLAPYAGRPEAAFDAIVAAARRILEKGARLLALGGDHAVTWPLIRAYRERHPDLTILHFDAHPDLYEDFEGNRFSHASPFARIMEEGLVRRLLQVGIRALNAHQRRQVERFGVEVLEMRQWRSDWLPSDLEGPLYLSFDMDALDPAFAPGVSHQEPGGLSVRDVLRVIQRLEVPVIGADIVELNPRRDPSGATAMVAAKLTKEIAARMLR